MVKMQGRCARFHRYSGYGALRTGFFPEILVLRQGSMFSSDRMDLD